MRIVTLTIFLLLLWTTVQGQQTIYDETRVLYRKELLGGLTLHGDGWGVNFFHGKHRTAKDRRMIGVEIVSMKHPKEIKSFNPIYEDSRGYFYGKQNALLIFRPTYGRKHQIADKIRRSGVEVNYVWSIGPSIGLLKPVYLQIGKVLPNSSYYESITIERYDHEKHDVHNIYGRATWFRGINEIVPHFGAFGRFGFGQDVAHVAGVGAAATHLARHARGVDQPRRAARPAGRAADRELGLAARDDRPGHARGHVDRARRAVLERRGATAHAGVVGVGGGDVGRAADQHQAGLAIVAAAFVALAVGQLHQPETHVRPSGALRGDVDRDAVGARRPRAKMQPGHQASPAVAASFLSVRRPSSAWDFGAATAGSCSASITIQPE